MSSMTVFSQYEEPTTTFLDVMEDDDSCAASLITEDLLALASRMILDTVAPYTRYSAAGECFLCVHQTEYKFLLGSPHWQDVLQHYVKSLADVLTDLEREDTEAMHQGYGISTLLSDRFELFPHVCSRCGKYDCGGDDECEWFFGEANVHKSMKVNVMRQRESQIHSGPCHCVQVRSKRRICLLCPNKSASCGFCGLCCRLPQCTSKHRRRGYVNCPSTVCACQFCNAVPDRVWGNCNFCAFCCTNIECSHNGGPIVTNIRHKFVNLSLPSLLWTASSHDFVE